MRLRSLLVTATAAATIFFGAPIGASALTSWNGSDYSRDFNGRKAMETCDRESDSTGVKAVYELRNGDEDSVRDDDGANKVCAQEGSGNRLITGHKTCETPDLWPDPCGNWQRY